MNEMVATPAQADFSVVSRLYADIVRRERLWPGTTPAAFRSIPNKPVLQFGGLPIWAELKLLSLRRRLDRQEA